MQTSGSGYSVSGLGVKAGSSVGRTRERDPRVKAGSSVVSRPPWFCHLGRV